MQNLQIIESRGINVLTSKQIAEWYGTTTEVIKKNFSNNRERYIEGKHYIALSGDELKAFKKQVNNLPLVNDEVKKVHLVANRTSHLYLWTEKGALLHAKSLNTAKAWEAYEYLVDYYFRAKEQEPEKPQTYREIREAALAQRRQQASASQPERKEQKMVVDIPENAKAQQAITDVKKALGAVEVMLDESARYISETDFKSCRDALSKAFLALLGRMTIYMKIEPKLIKR